jgi:mannosyl-3-phosphoglycerate synthase
VKRAVRNDMMLEMPRRTERFGSVKINGLQRVLLLDSSQNISTPEASIFHIPPDKIEEIEGKMAIIVPVKNEKLNLIEGVISAIPSKCLVIVVSNSRRDGLDRFRMEWDMVEQHVHYTRRDIWMAYQKDPKIGEALKKTKYLEILDENDVVRDGKAEGMILGMLLAKAAGKEYVGFVDSDNYVPGSVHEYVKIFCSAFYLSQSPYSMVRISWAYKPKILEGSIYFSKWGRVTTITNKYLNRLIGNYTGFDTEVVKTGNSGDHAMTLKLAEILEYRSQFAVEPSEITNILEQFGGIAEPKFKDPIEKGVEIFQIETRNPHFHEEKGEDHIKGMLADAISTILLSPLCSDAIKKEITDEFSKEKLPLKIEEKKIKSFSKVNTKVFFEHIKNKKAIHSFGDSANSC